ASSSPASLSELNQAVFESWVVAEARNPVASVYGGPGAFIRQAVQSFCAIHSAGCVPSTVLVSPLKMLRRSETLCSRAPAGIVPTSQWSAPLNDPPLRNSWLLQNCVLLVALLLPWSRAPIVTESSGVLGSSVRNERTLPARRSCVVRFSVVIAQ